MGIIKNTIAKIRTLWNNNPNSNIQKWITTLDDEMEDFYQKLYQEKRNYYLSTMEDWRMTKWERDLKLPYDPLLTLNDRRARLYKYLQGTKPVVYFVKDLIATASGQPYENINLIQSKTMYPWNRVKRFFYYLWIQANNSVVSFNNQNVLDQLEDIHTEHCILAEGNILIFLDFWEWDNASLPLDDIDFVTNRYYITLNGTLYEDITDNTNPDGNELQIDWFIDSASPTLKLFAREQDTKDLTVRIAKGGINLEGTLFNYAGGNSPVFTPPLAGTQVFLLYVWNDSGTFTLDIDNGTYFTSNDPQSYYDGLGTNIYPICEVTLTAGQTEISNSDIVDVRP